MNQKLDFMHKGHIDIYKTNESKLMIHAYTYTNRAPPIFTVCGYHRKKGSLDERVTFNYMYIVYTIYFKYRTFLKKRFMLDIISYS